ncbi:MAG: AsmA family protein [Rhodobacteraceae bacterium]|nr:MAG: AsmA family protein [Paracoccaceae bacterium]
MRLIKALVAMVLGLVVLIGAVLLLMPTERIANIAAQQFEGTTGRSISFGRSVRPSFYPVIGARAQNVAIGNPDWAGPEPMLTAEEMDIGLDVVALIRGDIQIERIVLQSPVLHLIRDASGRGNWELGREAAEPSAGTEATRTRQVSLSEAVIRNGRLRFEDAQAGIDLHVEALEAGLRLPALDGPADLSASGRLNGQAVAVNLTTNHAARFLAGNVTALALDLEAAGATITYAGRAGLDGLVAEGQMQADIPRPSALMAMLGQQGGDVSEDFLPLGLTGQLTRTQDGRLFARDAQFRAGAVRLAGAVDLDPTGARPRLTGQLAGDVLDLRSADGGGNGQAATPGWSRERIDASALDMLDAELSLRLAGLRTDATTLGRSVVGISIDRSRAVFDLREVAVFGGTLAGEFVMNNRSGLSVGGNLRARGIELLPLLSELADYRRLQGVANADLQFLGVGNSVHDIMNSLRGEGALRLSEGEIIGFDLAGMLRNLDMSYMGEQNRTVYQSVTGTFTITDGVLRNEDMRLEASRFSVTGQGRVGLGQRNLDYRVVPAALQGPDGETLRVPLMITGPWEAPRFRLDLEALAQERLRAEQERLEEIAREEAQRLEERARREAEERLQRELGVSREEGERLEDALRRGVEEEIGSRLRGLLGRD